MQAAGYLVGNAILRKFKTGATFSNIGIPTRDETDGVAPGSTTDWADTVGLATDLATHATAPAAGLEGLVTVDVNPNLIMRALMSGGAAEGTALTTLINTAADTTKLIVTDADVGTATFASGTMWCTKGANRGQSRICVTFNSAVDIRSTVAFYNTIAALDEFLVCPWAKEPVGTGIGNVQATTLLTQADASIVAGTGGVAVVVDLELNGASDSYVLYLFGDHIYGITNTI